MRVLFLGNSFTSRFDIPQQVKLLVDELTRADDEVKSKGPFEYESILRGGASLAQWNNDKNGLVGETLRKKPKFDFVVLQEQSNKPWKNREKFREAAERLHGKIKDAGAVTVLYQTTPWKDWVGKEEEENLLANYRGLCLDLCSTSKGRDEACLLAPVGETARLLRERMPNIEQWERDGRHPSRYVAFMAACAFARVFTGKSVAGASFPFPEESDVNLKPSCEESKCIASIVDEIFTTTQSSSSTESVQKRNAIQAPATIKRQRCR